MNLLKFLEIVRNSPLSVILPLHPRTKSRMIRFNLYEEFKSEKNLELLEPLGYLKFLWYEKNAKGIMTDSGGIQKEAFILKKPCITLRSTTEWVETLRANANRLLNLNLDEIIQAMNDIVSGDFQVNTDHPYGDGNSGKVIASKILSYFESGKIVFTDNIQR